jgi:hypothetical protein
MWPEAFLVSEQFANNSKQMTSMEPGHLALLKGLVNGNLGPHQEDIAILSTTLTKVGKFKQVSGEPTSNSA